MSAIGGIFDISGGEIEFSSLNRMRIAMSMRGRKRSSAYLGGNVGIIHNSSSPEAFSENEDAQPAIFERGGHSFSLAMDSELLFSSAVFEGYRVSGVDFLGALGGGFALALYDGERRMLLLARDKKGKKPLFYRIYKGQVYFASEVKGLTAAIGGSLSVSREMLSLHLCAPFGVYRATNILPDISEVLPGECILFTELGMSRFRYRERAKGSASRSFGKRERVFAPHPQFHAHELRDLLSSALIAFDYPQFDCDMSGLCRLFYEAEQRGERRVLFEDRARRKSLSYAEEREDRLGALYQIEAIGRIAREDNRPDSDGLFRMRERLVSMFLALDGRQTAFLSDILGERKLDFLMRRFERGSDEKKKDTESEIRILGMLYQTVMWAESRELVIKSTGDTLLQSALSTI